MSVDADTGATALRRDGDRAAGTTGCVAGADPLRFVPADARAAADAGVAGPWVVASALSREIHDALALLAQGMDALCAIGERGAFQALDPQCLLRMAGELERHRTRGIMVDARLVEAAEEDPSFAVVTGEKRVAHALVRSLRISVGEANARVRRGRQLLPRNGFSAGEQPPELPQLSAAVRAGSVTSGQVDEIGAAMRRIRTIDGLDASLLEQAEQALLEQAGALGPTDLKAVGEHLDEVLLPDGRGPGAETTAARRGLRIGRQRRDGTYAITGFLTPETKARVDAVLSPLGAPRPTVDGSRDARSADQRRHDALYDVMGRVLDLNGVPASGGTAATVHITVDMDAVMLALGVVPDPSSAEYADDQFSTQSVSNAGGDRARDNRSRYVGRLAGGDRLTCAEFLRLADEALVIPTWISAADGIVAYGRSRRIASVGQTNALIARDRGCSYPGCDVPPDWCQRHHVIEWWRGGRTDLGNLTLLCGHHHREFEKNGWVVRMVGGLPWWVPPPWIDPDQRPVLNTRIRIPDQQEIDDAARHASIRRSGCDDARATGMVVDDEECREEDRLDPADELIALLALHVTNPRERDNFHHELADLLAAYTGTRGERVADRAGAAPAPTAA